MKLANGTLCMVVDGSKMLLMRSKGDAFDPELEVIEHRAFENPANRELLTDAPGVAFGTAYRGRSTVGTSDPHQLNADRFAVDAARALGEAVRDSDNGLVVVAPPRTLAVLRENYGEAVKSRLITEFDKDLTRHSVAEIARLLADY